MKTYVGIALLLVAACLGGAWYWQSRSDGLPEFRTLPVHQGDLLIAVSATGTVEPVEVIDVGAQILGRIKSFGPDPNSRTQTIDFGSRVKKDAVLAQIDDSPYLVAREQARAHLNLTQAELVKATARLQEAENNFERAGMTRETLSESDYDRTIAAFETAKADVRVAEARLEQARITLQEAEINLGYTTIRSPIDGIVIDRRVNVGQTVVAGLNAPSLFLLARDLGRMQVLAAVNEADIGDITMGQAVTFKVDAHRESTFTGRVSQIRLNAGMSHNVVTYDVVIEIDNADGKLLPYMTASLQFEVNRRSDTLLVPNQALRWQPTPAQVTADSRESFAIRRDAEGAGGEADVGADSPAVWVMADDGRVRPVPLEVGLTDGNLSEVVSGELNPGTEVVVHAKRARARDFVSSFISRVTRSDNDD